MISIPLLKQSCKANAVVWSLITFVTCTILAVVILVLGNLSINTMRDTMSNMLLASKIDGEIGVNSIDIYDEMEVALTTYDTSKETLTTVIKALPEAEKIILQTEYNAAKLTGLNHKQAVELVQAVHPTDDLKLLVGTYLDFYYLEEGNETDEAIEDYILIKVKETVYATVLATEGKDAAVLATNIVAEAIIEYEAQNKTTKTSPRDFAINYVPNMIADQLYNSELEYDGVMYKVSEHTDRETIYMSSKTAIVGYVSAMDNQKIEVTKAVDYEMPISTPEEKNVEIANRLATYREEYKASIKDGIISKLPGDVVGALQQLAKLDVYALVVGEIFYRIAGILLPVIYTILCSSNLVAAQIDTGSMAYVLSTPTKRKTVTITQMLFLVGSIFLMCVATTVVSMISLTIMKSNATGITMNLGHLLKFNIGLFVTLFAISGICYLSSCWFNRSTQAMAIGGGIAIFSIVCTILGLFGSDVMPALLKIDVMNFFNFISVITLFDTVSIMNGTSVWLWKLLILIGIGVGSYIVGIYKFNKKDLPL